MFLFSEAETGIYKTRRRPVTVASRHRDPAEIHIVPRCSFIKVPTNEQEPFFQECSAFEMRNKTRQAAVSPVGPPPAPLVLLGAEEAQGALWKGGAA